MKIVGKNLYNHKFYLQMAIEENKSDDEPSKQKFCYSSENDYLHTIPLTSCLTISKYKHQKLKAMQQ